MDICRVKADSPGPKCHDNTDKVCGFNSVLAIKKVNGTTTNHRATNTQKV